jgi:hypothetical protein
MREMKLDDEADALREEIDRLAHGPADLDDWRRVDSRLSQSLAEAELRLAAVEHQMAELAATSEPCWSWLEADITARCLVGLIGELRLEQACVQSRIFELDAGNAAAS